MSIYYFVSISFKRLLTEHTTDMLEMVIQQAVNNVEEALDFGRKEVALMAEMFSPVAEVENPSLPGNISQDTAYLRTLFVTPEKVFSSDGGSLDVGSLPDIINAEGTDIAVSDLSHISWVTSQYNAREIIEAADGKVDAETLSIFQAEKKVLEGKSGMDTYYWNDGLCYIIYAPIPSMGWGLIGGMRDEELVAITQTDLFTSLAQSPFIFVAIGCFLILFVLLTYWITSSAKTASTIRKRLEDMAYNDSLTGLYNRHILKARIFNQRYFPNRTGESAAIFLIDIDYFKKYNDFYGHQKGDHCLWTVATILKNACDDDNFIVIRYGGEEFLIIAFLLSKEQAKDMGVRLRQLVEEAAMPNHADGVVTISVGICHIAHATNNNFSHSLSIADRHLYLAKERGRNQVVIDS